MAGIKLNNIQKGYSINGHIISVLKGINLTIPKNKITVVLGRSGCGKTTLLRIIGGLEKMDKGEVNFDTNQKTAYVFQEPRLMPWLNIWDNVKFGLKNEEYDNTIIQNVIDTCGLNGFERAYPNQLSGGMQQRTSLARALAYKPSFIMMDEPFAALDYFTRDQMQKELINLQYNQGVSILFVTHSIDEALLIGHKIVVIDGGRIKSEFVIETNNKERNLLDNKFIDLKKRIIEQLNL